MNFAAISGSYVKYIGAGMMISGGMIGAIRLIPTIINSVKATLDGRKMPKLENVIHLVSLLSLLVLLQHLLLASLSLVGISL